MKRGLVVFILFVLITTLSPVSTTSAKVISPINNLDFENYSGTSLSKFENWNYDISSSYAAPTFVSVTPSTTHLTSGSTSVHIEAILGSQDGLREFFELENYNYLPSRLVGDISYELSVDVDELAGFEGRFRITVVACHAFQGTSSPDWSRCYEFDHDLINDIDDTEGFQTLNYSNTISNPTDDIVYFELIFKFRGDSSKGPMNLDAYIDNMSFQVNVPSMPDDEVVTETDVGILVEQGSLELSVAPTVLTSVPLDVSNIMTTSSTLALGVKDETGNANGWTLKMSSSDFLSEPLADTTINNGNNLRLRIPAGAMSITLGDVQILGGQPIDPEFGPRVGDSGSLSTPRTLLSADAGFGMGEYSLPMTLSLVVPNLVEVYQLDSDQSKYSVGDLVGTRAGLYNATITFVLGVGL